MLSKKSISHEHLNIKDKLLISLYKDEKRMPLMNFKIVNAKTLKMELKKTAKIWHIYSLRF